MVEDNQVRAVDLKYSDLMGRWYHVTFPVHSLENALVEGIPFDGSSVPGLRRVESGDMVNVPDPETASICPFSEAPTLRMISSICDAETRIGVRKDPRSVAERARRYLKDTGVADEALFIPELEFYLFDTAHIQNDNYGSGYRVSSSQDRKCLPEGHDDGDALAMDHRKGYHMDGPADRYYDVRQRMVEVMEDLGVKVRYHHHEVGLAAQQEIETELSAFPKIADQVMIMKDIIRRVALDNGVSATFMPKPLYNEAGSGLHFHIQLKKNGENIFWKKGGYADLSEEAIWFIGGILAHGRSLTAFTNPSTNSYKRLLPGFEAPVKLIYGLANRSAAIRIPRYGTTPETKRFEFRTGDATCNPYLAMSALLMAGLDGIAKKINPTDHNYGPFDDNIFAWPEEKKATLHSIPANLTEALDALEQDHDYLLAGDVFNTDIIDTWISMKRDEINQVQHRPHPMEFNQYYNF